MQSIINVAQGICLERFSLLENISDHVNLLQDDAEDEIDDEHEPYDRETDEPHDADHVTKGVNVIYVDVFNRSEDD